jgi:hypothetical protein
MNRSMWFWLCVVLGLLALAAGLLVPIHLRAVDAGVISRAGQHTPTLVEEGLGMAAGQGLGAAEMMLRAAKMEQVPDAGRLELSIGQLARAHPDWVAWGGADSYLDKLFKTSATNSSPERVTEIIIQTENRAAGLKRLRTSSCPAVQELLRSRALTNTVIFPASASASGQAFDAAVVTCGLLLNEWHLTAGLSNGVYRVAAAANRGSSPEPLEQALLDVLALGQRFNWSQLSVFVAKIPDTDTLHRMANDVRTADAKLPLLFAVVELSGDPAGVARYLADFSRTGMDDLGASLKFGAGGVRELVHRGQQLHFTSLQQNYARSGPTGAFYRLAAGYCLRSPQLALAIKWIFYLAGGWFAAAALHFARPAATFLEEPLQVRGIHLAREFLFALGFLLMVLVLSEPFLTQNDQKAPPVLRSRLPMTGSAVTAEIKQIKPTLMNQSNLSLMTLLVFFVLQGLLYLSCLIKLAEIRRQRILPAMKLKLLENEDHLFDAGLYLGFAGTIVSLIFASLKIITFSLMAAYSCTAFGIIFVSIFKIFHLRPARRKLLLEADAQTRQPVAPVAPAGIHAIVPQP